jgi:hypothetical protein
LIPVICRGARSQRRARDRRVAGGALARLARGDVLEDLGDRLRLGDLGNDTHWCAAPRAFARVDRKTPVSAVASRSAESAAEGPGSALVPARLPGAGAASRAGASGATFRRRRARGAKEEQAGTVVDLLSDFLSSLPVGG